METFLRSVKKTVVIGPERPTVLIGERINPTGRKHLAAALAAGDLEIVRQEAVAQVEAGADILDINVGAAGIDELEMLPRAIQVVVETVDVPICIDTANVKALEAALAAYRQLAPTGKPLVNSVNGEEDRLEAVLPLVAKYGAAVIGLTMNEKGIPSTPEMRLAVARKIVERAEALGIPREDVLIDCLALAICTDTRAGRVTLDAIRMVRQELGVNQTLGASNISFGLPDREVINLVFLGMAILQGVNCPIVDVAKVRPAVLAADLVLGHDVDGMRYIRAYKKRRQQG